MIFRFPNWAGPRPTGSMTWRATGVGSASGWIMTRPFAVETIRRWRSMGQAAYLFTAARRQQWLASAAVEAGIAEAGGRNRAAELPARTSKWNKIEHRLFSYISQNWRGKPLISHEVIVNLIAATTTRTGLQVHAELDTGVIRGIKITHQQMAALKLRRDKFHGEWNYTLLDHRLTTDS